MKKIELFECGPLKARISAIQCLTNRIKATLLKEMLSQSGPGLLACCLRCELGRRVRAFLPEDQE